MRNNSDQDHKINMSQNLKSEKDNESTLGVPIFSDQKAEEKSLLSDAGSPRTRGKPSYKQGPVRWLALFFACCFLLGSYFCYDNPGPIEKTMEKYLDISQSQYVLLYSVYSYPNIVLPVFGGIFLDMIGLRIGILLFTIVLTIGQAVFAIGGQYDSLGIMIAGRVIFGLGGESMSVAQSAIVSKWFKGKELSMAMGLNISVSRLGSVINGFVVPQIYNDANHDKLGIALFVGLGVCIFSLVCAILLILMDKRAEVADGNNGSAPVLTDEDKFKFSDIKTFNKSFWLLCFSCVVVYMAIFPFIQVASGMLQDRFHFSETTAGQLFGIPYTISACTSPFLGFFIDKVGKRVLLVIISSVILLLAHLSNMFFEDCDQCYTELCPLILVGIGYSIYGAALWGSIPYVVEARTVGTAFGFVTAIQNGGMALAPTIGGAIHDVSLGSKHGYFYQSMFWMLLCVLGFLLNIMLYIEDIRNNGRILDKVHKNSEEETIDLITSPTAQQRREIQTKEDINENEKEYLLNPNTRNALKRSMAKLKK